MRDPQGQQAQGEFAVSRGESQVSGDPGIFGIPPSVAGATVGIAPPDARVVVSIFDTRPIGAYDFSVTDFDRWNFPSVESPGVPPLSLGGVVPSGYVAVLRSVEVVWTPGAFVNIGNEGFGADTFNVLTLKLLRNGGVIPNASTKLFGDLTVYEWPTHQVFGPGERYGLVMVPSPQMTVPSPDQVNTVIVSATFRGTLIPSHGLPPSSEIASLPVLVAPVPRLTT